MSALACALLSAPLLHPAGARRNKTPEMTPQEMAHAAVDDAMRQSIDRARSAAEAAPDSPDAVYGWAGALSAAGQAGTIGRGQIDDLDLDAFFAAVDAHPEVGELSGTASSVALAAGRKGQALVLAERSLAAGPTNAALLTWFQVSNDPSDSATHCAATLSAAGSDIQRFDTIAACDAALGADWLSAADRGWYEQETARRAASQAAHTALLQAEVAAHAAEMAASHAAWQASQPEQTADAAPAGPSTVSVRLKVTCDQKVRMFEGSSPTSGGTYGWQSCWTASGSQVDLEMGCGGFIQR